MKLSNPRPASGKTYRIQHPRHGEMTVTLRRWIDQHAAEVEVVDAQSVRCLGHTTPRSGNVTIMLPSLWETHEEVSGAASVTRHGQ